MRIRDLGTLSGNILVFGGPYSNFAATVALMQKAKRLGIPASNCICTGDVVAYCADAADTVHSIREFGCPVVAGNCELQLAVGAEDCGCGFEEGTTCDLLSVSWYNHATQQIREEDRAWMGNLPDALVFEYEGRRFGVLHGGATDVARFLWSISLEDAFLEEIAALETYVGPVDAVLAGHSGIAFTREINGKLWINAGAIGMPPNDGRPETRYVILNGTDVEIKKLRYDHGNAIHVMEQAGLTHGYHDALRTGFWPSEDVLPEELRRVMAE